MNILPEFLLPLQKHHDLFMNWAGDMKKNHGETNCQKKIPKETTASICVRCYRWDAVKFSMDLENSGKGPR